MSTDIFMLDILLDRAESHPEEFGASGKWVRIIDHYDDCLTEEEKKKVTEVLYKARRARFNEALMKALAGEDAPTFTEDAQFTFNTKNRLQTFPSNSMALNYPNTNYYGESLVKRVQEIQEEQEMKAMHEYYKDMGATK